MLDRRAVLRTAAFVALAGPVLSVCGSGRSGGGKAELVSSPVRRTPADTAELPAAVRSAWRLGAGVWNRSAADPGNIALSPYSILVALGMTLNGADGTTREEMLAVLGTGSEHELNGGLNALTRGVEALSGADVELAAANQLFGQQGVAWEEAFLDSLAREYGAGLRAVDFAGDAESARGAVNAWTAEQTRDRIPEILPQDSVSTLTRLVLVNTLYLKAGWLAPFSAARTTDGPFHLADGTTVEVPTMHGLAGAAYAEGEGWAAVRLPLAGGELAMTLVLPGAGRSVDLDDLPAVLAAVRPASVEVALPRWTFRSAFALGETLAGLGMPTAFAASRADFTRMADAGEQLVLADVHHQVFMAVDEEGVEAAAATAVGGTETTSVESPVVDHTLVLDRPFLFVVHDVDRGTPLFVGRVDDPR